MKTRKSCFIRSVVADFGRPLVLLYPAYKQPPIPRERNWRWPFVRRIRLAKEIDGENARVRAVRVLCAVADVGVYAAPGCSSIGEDIGNGAQQNARHFPCLANERLGPAPGNHPL